MEGQNNVSSCADGCFPLTGHDFHFNRPSFRHWAESASAIAKCLITLCQIIVFDNPALSNWMLGRFRRILKCIKLKMKLNYVTHPATQNDLRYYRISLNLQKWSKRVVGSTTNQITLKLNEIELHFMFSSLMQICWWKFTLQMKSTSDSTSEISSFSLRLFFFLLLCTVVSLFVWF